MIQLLLFLILFLILIGVLLSCTSKIVNAINNAGKTQQQIQADTDEYLAFLKWRKTRRGRK